MVLQTYINKLLIIVSSIFLLNSCGIIGGKEKVDATEKKLKQTLELGGRTQAELSTGYTQCSKDIENVRQQLIVANNTIDRLKSDNKNNTVLELELDKSKKVASTGLQDLDKIKKQYENSQSEIKKLTDLNNKLQTQLDNEVLKMSATISELDSAAIEITDLKKLEQYDIDFFLPKKGE